MRCTETVIRGAITVTPLDRRLDAVAAPDLQNRLIRHLETGRHVVLDLSNIEFMDSSGLGSLVRVLKRAETTEAFSLCNLHDAVAALFALSHLDRAFRIIPTTAATSAGPKPPDSEGGFARSLSRFWSRWRPS